MRTLGNGLHAIAAILAGIALILGTSACSWFGSRQTNEPTPNGSTTPASKITVVATLNQWGSLAKQIGGNQVEVSSILPPDTTNAHSFEPNAKQVTQMRKAQVLLTNGAGYDTWADRSLPRTVTRVSVADTVGALDGDNPHLWFSRDARQAVARELTEVFSRLLPEHKAYFESNLKTWQSDEDELESQMRERSKSLKDPTYAATEDVAYYLMSDLGFRDVTPKGYAKAMLDGTEPDEKDIKAFSDLLQGRQTNLLINNPQQSAQTDATLTQAAHKASIPVIDITEQMPKDCKDLTSWIDTLSESIISKVSQEQEHEAASSPSPSVGTQQETPATK